MSLSSRSGLHSVPNRLNHICWNMVQLNSQQSVLSDLRFLGGQRREVSWPHGSHFHIPIKATGKCQRVHFVPVKTWKRLTDARYCSKFQELSVKSGGQDGLLNATLAAENAPGWFVRGFVYDLPDHICQGHSFKTLPSHHMTSIEAKQTQSSKTINFWVVFWLPTLEIWDPPKSSFADFFQT